MPQLDQLTYFSQFLWLCVLLFSFFILLFNNNNGILGISRILKLRNQLLSHRGNKIQSKDPKNLEDIPRKGFSTGLSYIYSSFSEVSQWCKTVDYFGKSLARKITQISDFGGISGSRGMERQIPYLISKSSYNTSSSRITCWKNIKLTHAPHGLGVCLRVSTETPAPINRARSFSSGDKVYWTNIISLKSISDRWEEITGKPDSSSWLHKLRNYALQNNWTTPPRVLENYDLKHVAQLQKRGKVQDVMRFVTDREDRQNVRNFFIKEKIDPETGETLLPRDVPATPPLDQKEEPEPARDWDLNKSPRPEPDPQDGDLARPSKRPNCKEQETGGKTDLNPSQMPMPELDLNEPYAGDDGGGE